MVPFMANTMLSLQTLVRTVHYFSQVDPNDSTVND